MRCRANTFSGAGCVAAPAAAGQVLCETPSIPAGRRLRIAYEAGIVGGAPSVGQTLNLVLMAGDSPLAVTISPVTGMSVREFHVEHTGGPVRLVFLGAAAGITYAGSISADAEEEECP